MRREGNKKQDVFSAVGPVCLGVVEVVWEGRKLCTVAAFGDHAGAYRWVHTLLAVKRNATGRYRVISGAVAR